MLGSVRLVSFEGLPGSGKTTSSRGLAEHLRAHGVACGWAREEDPSHPFFGPDVRARHRAADYDGVCLAQWELVAASTVDRSWCLDACALQSTVRFMFEQSWTFDRIQVYWRRFEDVVAPVGAAHVYLTHADPEAFVREHVMSVRGPVWAKIAAYVAATPAGVSLASAGLDAPVEFWVRYRSLCDALMAGSALPVLTVDTTNGWAYPSEEIPGRLAGLAARGRGGRASMR